MIEASNYMTLDTQLTFGNSVFPKVITNQQKFTDVDQATWWVQDNLVEIERQLMDSGAVLFRGFPLVDADSFDAFSAAFGYSSFTYHESLSNAVRINFTERVFTANEAPKDVEIFLHHEMAQTPISPQKIFFFCQTAADKGGATPICRSDQLYTAIEAHKPELVERFERLGVLYTTNMPNTDDIDSGQGRSWMSTLSVETVAQAETKLAELGYTWHW